MKRLALLLALLLLHGCGWMSRDDEEPGEVAPVIGERAEARAMLLDQWQAWRGVPYRMGGSDRRGLDCSAFAQLTLRQRFGIVLPRESGSQRAAGIEIPLARAQPGDLLFFDTGVRRQHVGIYAGEQQFLHVSTRAGVTLSSLLDPYWAPRLRAAVRPRV